MDRNLYLCLHISQGSAPLSRVYNTINKRELILLYIHRSTEEKGKMGKGKRIREVNLHKYRSKSFFLFSFFRLAPVRRYSTSES